MRTQTQETPNMSDSTTPSMTTPNELGRLIEEMTDQISDAYQNDTTGYVLVRHFQFIHRNIGHLTEEVM